MFNGQIVPPSFKEYGVKARGPRLWVGSTLELLGLGFLISTVFLGEGGFLFELLNVHWPLTLIDSPTLLSLGLIVGFLLFGILFIVVGSILLGPVRMPIDGVHYLSKSAPDENRKNR